jgi:imidazolonepropionase-like amidohydrolase
MTRTVFSGGILYDGTSADPAPGDVVVEAGRILDVGSGLDGDEVVDCTGHWVSPGFFDTHVHVMFNQPDFMRLLQTPFSLPFFEAVTYLRRTLDAGITSVRDAGGADLGVKVAVDTGVVAGPRMQISVNMLSQTGGHGDSWEVCGSHVHITPAHPGRPDTVVDGPDEMRKKVRELIRAGADVIKIATSGGVLSSRDDPSHAHFRESEIAVAVEEATAAGRFVMAHAQSAEGIKNAVRSGVRSIEHGVFLDDEGIAMMLERGTWLVPTLHAPRSVISAIEAGAALPDAVKEKAYALVELHRQNIRRAYEAGVKIAMGTDCGVGAHGTNLDELEMMRALGMSPVETLHATTGSAADLLAVDADRGRIRPGLRADLVVVEGSPDDVADIAARVRGVYLDGVLASSGQSAASSPTATYPHPLTGSASSR